MIRNVLENIHLITTTAESDLLKMVLVEIYIAQLC